MTVTSNVTVTCHSKNMDKIFTFLKSFRGEMKKSRFKIWLRAFLFLQFSAIFMVYFFRDIGNGYFSWGWVALIFASFIPIGFLLSLIVPMKADTEIRAVTFSLDRFLVQANMDLLGEHHAGESVASNGQATSGQQDHHRHECGLAREQRGVTRYGEIGQRRRCRIH